ncbi:hypothetical protein FACS189494_01110 [Spirochaetia bacterium]|nr:hypothetical protein FACS189494_01110 [Spirochaetia bacterium]
MGVEKRSSKISEKAMISRFWAFYRLLPDPLRDCFIGIAKSVTKDYKDLQGTTQNGDISAIEFNLDLKMSPEIVPTIADEAVQEIKSYFSSKGLSLRK